MWVPSGMERIIKGLIQGLRQPQWPPKAEILPEANYLEVNGAENTDMGPLGPDTELPCELWQIS